MNYFSINHTLHDHFSDQIELHMYTCNFTHVAEALSCVWASAAVQASCTETMCVGLGSCIGQLALRLCVWASVAVQASWHWDSVCGPLQLYWPAGTETVCGPRASWHWDSVCGPLQLYRPAGMKGNLNQALVTLALVLCRVNFSHFFTLWLCGRDLRILVCLLTGYNILNW